MAYYRKIFLFLLITLSVSPSFARVNCEIFLTNRSAPHVSLWHELRENDLLVSQNSIPEKEGLCGTACAVNIVQAALVTADLEPLSDPHSAYRTLLEFATHSKSPFSMPTVMASIRFLLDSLYPGQKFNISGTLLKEIEGSEQNEISAVEEITQETIKPAHKKLKLLFTVQLDEYGEAIIQHAQIAIEYNGKAIALLDPNRPDIDLEANRSEREFSINGYPTFLFQYNDPTQIEGFWQMVPFGVITIDLSEVSK